MSKAFLIFLSVAALEGDRFLPPKSSEVAENRSLRLKLKTAGKVAVAIAGGIIGGIIGGYIGGYIGGDSHFYTTEDPSECSNDYQCKIGERCSYQGSCIATYPATSTDNVCRLPVDDGAPGRALFHRFYFNTSTSRCEGFQFYGGIGNGNNFHSKEDCQARCGVTYDYREIFGEGKKCAKLFGGDPNYLGDEITEKSQCQSKCDALGTFCTGYTPKKGNGTGCLLWTEELDRRRELAQNDNTPYGGGCFVRACTVQVSSHCADAQPGNSNKTYTFERDERSKRDDITSAFPDSFSRIWVKGDARCRVEVSDGSMPKTFTPSDGQKSLCNSPNKHLNDSVSSVFTGSQPPYPLMR